MNERVKTALSLLGWIVAYFIYLVLGAFIYVVLEKSHDLDLKRSSRNDLLTLLASFNISSNDTTIKAIVASAVKAHALGGLDLSDFNKDTSSSWNLASAVFFSSTIVTTIGYGNIAPVTYSGRTFTIIYALLGIPFTGVVLAKIGVGISNLIKRADVFIGARIMQCFPRSAKQENMKKHIRLVQIMFVVLIFIVFFWILPAVLMTATDNMTMADAMYFCFMSLTTIGLGDIVPGVSTKDVSAKMSTEAIQGATLQVFTILYFLLGLSALTIMLTLIGSLIKAVADTTIKHGKDTIKNAGMVAGAGARMIEGVGRTVRRSVVRRESPPSQSAGVRSSHRYSAGSIPEGSQEEFADECKEEEEEEGNDTPTGNKNEHNGGYTQDVRIRSDADFNKRRRDSSPISMRSRPSSGYSVHFPTPVV